MSRGVSLSYAEPVRREGELVPSWRVVITASDGVEMPEELFLFQRVWADDAHTASVDELITVVTPFDITTYPIDDPAVGQDPPFFRKSVIDVFVPTLDAADFMWETVQAAVCDLKRQMDRLDLLVDVETVRCGDDLDDSESVSESL
jgi:hypothetical protein